MTHYKPRNDAVLIPGPERRRYVPTIWGRNDGTNTKWVGDWAEFVKAGGCQHFNEDQTEIVLTLPEGYKFGIRFNEPEKAPPLWQKEFPRMTDMPEIPEGFSDASWHNDAMPVFIKGEADSPDCLSIWIDYPNKADSDLGDVRHWHRFTLVRGPYGEVQQIATLCYTDDWQAILKAAARAADEDLLDNFNYVGSRHHY